MKPNSITQVGISSILNFLQYQIPIKYFKAIKALFKSCCELNITDIKFTCTGANTATIVVTILQPVTFYDTPISIVLSDGVRGGFGTQTNSNTFTFTNYNLSGATTSWTLGIEIPTSSDGNIGYYTNSAVFTATAPTCS